MKEIKSPKINMELSGVKGAASKIADAVSDIAEKNTKGKYRKVKGTFHGIDID
jgi:hypothetical protein